jgi:hypothetical protein
MNYVIGIVGVNDRTICTIAKIPIKSHYSNTTSIEWLGIIINIQIEWITA